MQLNGFLKAKLSLTLTNSIHYHSKSNQINKRNFFLIGNDVVEVVSSVNRNTHR